MKKVFLLLLLCTMQRAATAQHINRDSVGVAMYNQFHDKDFRTCLQTCTYAIDSLKTKNANVYSERALCYYYLTVEEQDAAKRTELYKHAVADFAVAKSMDAANFEYTDIYERCKKAVQAEK